MSILLSFYHWLAGKTNHLHIQSTLKLQLWRNDSNSPLRLCHTDDKPVGLWDLGAPSHIPLSAACCAGIVAGSVAGGCLLRTLPSSLRLAGLHLDFYWLHTRVFLLLSSLRLWASGDLWDLRTPKHQALLCQPCCDTDLLGLCPVWVVEATWELILS